MVSRTRSKKEADVIILWNLTANPGSGILSLIVSSRTVLLKGGFSKTRKNDS